MSAPLTPALAGFDEPIEMLRACHERIEQQCGTLERLVPHVKAHGCDTAAREAATAVLRYFDQAGPPHHADEEQDLFPRLLAAATGEEAERVALLVTSLLADHREMETLWAGVRRALEPLAKGDASRLDSEGVAAFCALYRRHMATEEGEVLALAERVLAPEALAEVGRAMSLRRGVKPVEGVRRKTGATP